MDKKEEGDTLANLKQAKTDEDIKRLSVNAVKQAYHELAIDYNHILNGDYIYCPHCGKWKSVRCFYGSNNSVDKIERFACKECILDMCTSFSDDGTRIDDRQKTIDTFRQLNWYFNEKDYNAQIESLSEGVNEKLRGTAAQQLIVMVRSLGNQNWRGLTFADSVFSDEDEQTLQLTSKRTPRKEIIKIFGSGFTSEDYLYLQDQYDDWCSRTEVNSKSQQTYIIQICFKQLEIWKAQKVGKDTDKLVKSLNDLMNGANLQPRQNVGNAATDSLTFGQLIEKWELESPVPEAQGEFADPDNIGKFLRVWFKGSLMRALGLDGGYSQEYYEYVKQYSVERPQNIDDDDSVDETMYEKVFGKDEV